MTKLIKVKYDDLTEVAQSAPQAVEFEEIASGSVDLPVSTNKSIFLDSFDQEFKAIDSLGVVSTFGGSAGGLQPVFIDHTGIPAELIRDRIYEADFSGATAGSTLTVTFPEGTGAETFIIGFRITGLSENSSVTFQTTNSQNIFFPDATTDTSLTGVNTPTYLEFAWDQSRYVYGDVYDPTYIDARGLFENDDQVLTEAGEISSTSQDTSLWPTVNGNKVKKGKLALSTSASTTITNAQTVYPELWANAPAAWQSGTDLVIPAQSVSASAIPYTPNLTLSSPPTSWSIDNTQLVATRRGSKLVLSGWSEIESSNPYPNGSGVIVINLGETVNREGAKGITLYTITASSEGWVHEQSAMIWTQNPSGGTISSVAIYTSDGVGNSNVGYAELNNSLRIYWQDIEFEVPSWALELPTPTISLYNNLVPTSLTIDLPEATSNVEGATKRAFFLAQAGSQQTITGTATPLNLDPPLLNEGFTVSGANNETIAVNNAGVYKISAHVTFNLLATTESVRIEIYAGGVRKSTTTTGAPDGSAIVSAVSFTMVELNANDTIEIRLIMASGSATTLTSRDDYTQVTIERMNA